MTLNLFDLSNKVIVVTGGAGLLGRSMAVGLAAAGARVVVADMQADAAASVVSELGNGAIAQQVNITDRGSLIPHYAGIRWRGLQGDWME